MRGVRVFTIFAFLLGFFIVSSCGWQIAKPKAVVVLFDVSGSTANQPRGADDRTARQHYFEDFKGLLRRMNGSDVLVSGTINDRSANEPFVINVSFPKNSLFSNLEDVEEEMNRVRLLALTTAGKLLRNNAPLTDILGALRQVPAAFTGYPHHYHVLVIFSDMVQESREYRMGRNGPPDGEAARLLESWRRIGGVPQLAGVDVYVWGANYPDERARLQIERFWRDLFSATGARLQEYAPAMIRFGEYR